MPEGRGQLSNAQIAAVLTYVRTAWNNSAPAVSEDQVAAARSPEALSGAELFATKCATCHQAAGQGTSIYPPLAGNPVVSAADPSTMIGVIVNGRVGLAHGQRQDLRQPDADLERAALGREHCGGSKLRSVCLGQQCPTRDGGGSRCCRLTGFRASRGFHLCQEFRAACHQANGNGGVGPALAENPHVNVANPTPMLTTILQGRNLMPSWRGQLSATDIAAVATSDAPPGAIMPVRSPSERGHRDQITLIPGSGCLPEASHAVSRP